MIFADNHFNIHTHTIDINPHKVHINQSKALYVNQLFVYTKGIIQRNFKVSKLFVFHGELQLMLIVIEVKPL